MRVRSEVLARKKILINDPVCKGMNETQWLFELESLYAKEEQRYDELKLAYKMIKNGLVELLGLNLMPVEDEIPYEERSSEEPDAIGEEKVFRRLRLPNEDEIVPLSILVGNPEIVSEMVKRLDEYKTQEEIDEKEEKGEVVSLDPDDLDAFMRQDLDEGDIEFLDDPKKMNLKLINESPEFKLMHDAFVRPLSEINDDPIITGKDMTNPYVRNLPKSVKSRVVLE